MKQKLKNLLFVVLSILLPSEVGGQNIYGHAPQPAHWAMVSFEEDLRSFMVPIIYGTNAKDQNYTLGLGFGGSLKERAPILAIHKLFFDRTFLRKISVLNDNAYIPINNSWKIVGGGFTPDSLEISYVIHGDRPYAFVICMRLTRSALRESDLRKFKNYGINIGMIGTSIGEWLQTTVHESSNDGDTHNPRTPKGWDNQISDKGELTILLTYNEDYLLVNTGLRRGIINFSSTNHRENTVSLFDLKVAFEANAGYYTGASIGLGARFGILDPRNWITSHNTLNTVNRLANPSLLGVGSDNTDYFGCLRNFELYFFGNAKPTYMPYNALLLGQFSNTKYRLPYKDYNPFYLEWQFGIGTTIPIGKCLVNAGWIFNAGRTSELKTSYSRTHYWGGVTLQIGFP